MKNTVRFLLALLMAFLLMMVVRAVGVTLFNVEGNALEPMLVKGDHILVNRWSYGLRIGAFEGLFNYGRIGKQPIAKGDLVAFENPLDSTRHQILICRCAALPGDSIRVNGVMTIVPSIKNCDEADFYWMESINPDNALDSRSLGFIAENLIIGRAVLVVYNHEPSAPLWSGWHTDRMLLPL